VRAISGRQTCHRVRFEKSDATAAASPKLNVLGPALAAATHELILTKDSNISLHPDGLACFVSALTPDVGLVVGVPLAVRPKTFAGHIEAFLINGHTRVLLTASTLGLGMGIGKVMLFRQKDLHRIGGVAALSHTIAEDNAFAKAMAAIGLKTRFAVGTVDQETGARSLRQVIDRQIRWAVIRRCQEPLTFLLEPAMSPLIAAIAAAIAAPLVGISGWPAFGATLAGWLAGEIVVSALKGWEVSPWAIPAFLGREILSLTAWVRAWVRQDVVWASGRYNLAAEVSRGVRRKS
jgi:ceramide glucosyltransferase